MNVSDYKLIKSGNGFRYMLNGRLVKRDSIDPEIIVALHNLPDNPKPEVRVCFFCGEGCKHSRFINLQTIYLCDDHYYSKTVGQIAQKMREDSETQEKES